MVREITPAVLAQGARATQRVIDRLAPLSGRIHLDVLDGSLFAHQKNLVPEDLRILHLPGKTTVHLMVQHPAAWLRACYAAKVARVILQTEANVSPELLKEAKRHFRLVFALSPGTSWSVIQRCLPYSEGFQVMTVDPGSQGKAFLPEQLSLVRKLHATFPQTFLAVDGGVTEATIAAAARSGAHELVVGSYFARARYPQRAYERLRKLAHVA